MDDALAVVVVVGSLGIASREVSFVFVGQRSGLLVHDGRTRVRCRGSLVHRRTVLQRVGGVLADRGIVAGLERRLGIRVRERVLVLRLLALSLGRRAFLVASPRHATTVGPASANVHCVTRGDVPSRP